MYEFKKLAKPIFLVASQMLGLGKHTFDHLLGFVPVSVNAGTHKLFAGPWARTMCGDDIGNQRRKLIYDLHGHTSLNIYNES